MTIEDFDNLTTIVYTSIANTNTLIARIANTNIIVDLYNLSNTFFLSTFANIETFISKAIIDLYDLLNTFANIEIFILNIFFLSIKESLAIFSLRSFL